MQCTICGKESNRKQCSDSCRKQSMKCYQQKRYDENRTYIPVINHCQICGVLCGRKKYCSEKCKIASYKTIEKKCIQCKKMFFDFPKSDTLCCSRGCASKIKCRLLWNNPPIKIISVSCVKCQKRYIKKGFNKGNNFCSLKCRNTYKCRNRKHKIRAGGCGDDISIGKLLERDGWRCALCKKKIHKSRLLKAYSRLSPTIDHIIPISLGGKHTWDNVQVAHLRCNSKKNNRGTGDQMLLFG